MPLPSPNAPLPLTCCVPLELPQLQAKGLGQLGSGQGQHHARQLLGNTATLGHIGSSLADRAKDTSRGNVQRQDQEVCQEIWGRFVTVDIFTAERYSLHTR